MKIRFNKNDVVDTKSLEAVAEDVDILFEEVDATNLEENTEPNLNMLLLAALYDQAEKMSGNLSATVLALTGMERADLMAYLQERIESFSAEGE